MTLLLGLGAACAASPAQSPTLAALRAHQWALAKTLAEADPDALSAKLAEFVKILVADGADAPPPAAIAGFMRENPLWPDQTDMARRYDSGLAADPDETEIFHLCDTTPPGSAPARLRCAEAYALAGQTERADQQAKAAWLNGVTDQPAENAFLARWANAISQRDQRARFERLASGDRAAAQRQAARLDPPHRLAAAARLAFRADDPRALARLAAVPPDLRGDTGLVLEQARYLRRSQALAASLALWQGAGDQAEAASPAEQRAAFWQERDRLARLLLEAGNDQGAFSIAQDAHAGSEQQGESLFLSGWIALRRLHDAPRAAASFKSMISLSHAAISQARAHYWFSRAAAAAGDTALSAREMAQAAGWPTTYYGQLAALETVGAAALTARIAALRDPEASAETAQAFDHLELSRAARKLVAWGDRDRARDFLRALAQQADGTAHKVLSAREALRLGLPDMAVLAARLAGREGVVLPESGWPAPFSPPGPLDPSIGLAIMRQESSFDPDILSPAGATGLMQLMPATASETARAQKLPGGAGLTDPDWNMRLGTAYFQSLLESFAGVRAYAIAAYNAGPRRVRDWIAKNGDPGATGDSAAMIDWIEQIPVAETRNYVQRVTENIAIYAAKGASHGK